MGNGSAKREAIREETTPTMTGIVFFLGIKQTKDRLLY